MSCLHRNEALLAPHRLKQRTLNRRARRDLQQRSPLEHALYAEEIPEIEEASVYRHMAQKIHDLQHQPPTIQKIRKRKEGVMSIGYILIILSAMIGILQPVSFAIALVGVGVGLTLLSVGFYGKMETIVKPAKSHAQAAWVRQALYAEWLADGNYVPPSVMKDVKAIEIALPGVRAYVHSLDADPFMELEYQCPRTEKVEKKFIGFWAEDFVLP